MTPPCPVRGPLLVIALALIAAIPAGCASSPRGPYSSITTEMRRPSEADRLNAEAADLLGRDPERAERLLRAALTADLYHGPAHNNLGVLMLQEGNLYEAANEFEWARKLLPGHPDPRMNLALVLETAGRTDEAIAMYRTALEVYPGHLPTLEALTRLQVAADKEDDRTPEQLAEIAMRSDDPRWREWARMRTALSR